MQVCELKPFSPPKWAKNPHLQTILAKYLSPKHQYAEHVESFELSDGDVLQLNWTLPFAKPNQPLAILLHGLEGNADSHYVRGMTQGLLHQGFAVLLMHFRGCNGQANRLARAYHSGDTADFGAVVALCQQRFSSSPLVAIGFSLGGNVLVKYLGETASTSPLTAAVSVCAPLHLADSCDRINQGLSKIFYQPYLLGRLKRTMQRKLQANKQLPVGAKALKKIRTIRQFDDLLTAPLHGFVDAADYYARCSGLAFIGDVTTPLWLIHAADDPFLAPSVVPKRLPQHVMLSVSPHGGHVGFVYGTPWAPRFWLNEVIPSFLQQQLQDTAC